MVIGSDTPRVAIYEDGETIFVKNINKRPVYYHARLDAAGLAGVKTHLQEVKSLSRVKHNYNMGLNATDLPEAKIYIRDDGKEIATSVYGLMASGSKLRAYTQTPGGANPDLPPQQLLKLHKWLCDLDLPNSAKWTPKYVEVMLWDYSYAPDASVRWPKSWPSLKSERCVKRKDAYSIYLDAALLPQLEMLIGSQKSRGAVKVGDRKFAIAYRYTFPHDPDWRTAFSRADK